MVLQVGFIDGYDHYDPASNTTLGGLFTTHLIFGGNGAGAGPEVSLVTGLNGRGKAIFMNAGILFFGGGLQRIVPSHTKLSYNFSLRPSNVCSSRQDPILYFKDGMNNTQFSLKLNPTGRLSLHGEGDAQMGLTSFPLQENVTHRFCLLADLDGSTSKLYIDGDLTKGWDVSGVDLRDSSAAGDIQSVTWWGIAGNAGDLTTYTFDDSVYCHGEAQFLGELEIDTAGPVADILKQWTPLSGTDNFAMIDEIPVDGDTTYNHGDAVGLKDLFEFDSLPTNPESIFCCSLINLARKEESATRTVRNFVRLDGSDFFGQNENLSTDYQYFYTHFMQNPDTAAAWLAAEREAARFGYDSVL